MTSLLFHVEDGLPIGETGEYVGSPMYSVIPEHGAALVLLGLVAIAWLLVRRAAAKRAWAGRAVGRYQSLDSLHRFLAWLLVTSGVVHLGLVLGHEPYFMSGLWLAAALTAFEVTRRLLAQKRWRRWAALLLFGSIVGYVVSSASGEAPDQVGLATKLVELTALGIVLTPQEPHRRFRRLAASGAMVLMVVVTAVGAWVGGFVAGDGGHHLGDVPAPGFLIPAGEDREPTAHERAEAEHLHAATVAALAKYADPAVAAADGYEVGDIFGRDHHAANPAYQADDLILDPERPETLVYAATRSGPVLLGAMFEMPGINQAGPAIGGPLTVWHGHDHVCFSLTPPALAGLTSPFGACPVGSITIPKTGEMMHVWTLPGAPDPFGDLDEEWLDDYLAAVVAGR